MIDKVIKDSYKTLIQIGNKRQNLNQMYEKYLMKDWMIESKPNMNNTFTEMHDKNSLDMTIHN